jgi:hypothetical protein
MAENGGEVITRRKEQNMMEKSENIQIDKSKTIDKKDILIPKAQEVYEISDEILKFKKDLTARLHESQPGYIHFAEICPHPDPEEYELEDEDLTFLKRIFPKELKVAISPQQILTNPIILDFLKLIEYIELTRDFNCTKAHLTSQKFTPEVLEKVIDYWKYKTAKTKYPLLRRFWKGNIKKTEFGELDPLRVAFREREKERMRLRKIMKLTEQEILEKLQQMKSEAEIALVEARMIVAREQIKMYSLHLQINKEELPFSAGSIKSEYGSKWNDVLHSADKIIQVYNPPPIPIVEPKVREQPVIVEQSPTPAPLPVPKPVDNDMAFFISSLISELYLYGFELSDFKSDNIKTLNEKIRKLKRPSTQTVANSLERTLFFGPPQQKPMKPEPENLVLYKILSYSNPSDVFIEKQSEESFLDADLHSYQRENFVHDFLAKRDLDYFRSQYSMCRTPTTLGSNPYVFCGGNDYSNNNSHLERLKTRHYSKILGSAGVESDHLENTFYPYHKSIHDGNLVQLAQRQLTDMKFEVKFKNFLSTKRVK